MTQVMNTTGAEVYDNISQYCALITRVGGPASLRVVLVRELRQSGWRVQEKCMGRLPTKEAM